ncbi:hypothetical protein DI005_24570 [Prauserella sp. PE36]|nr:hypothetical protein DI005_24570 [Prauserella sp. PE36]
MGAGGGVRRRARRRGRTVRGGLRLHRAPVGGTEGPRSRGNRRHAGRRRHVRRARPGGPAGADAARTADRRHLRVPARRRAGGVAADRVRRGRDGGPRDRGRHRRGGRRVRRPRGRETAEGTGRSERRPVVIDAPEPLAGRVAVVTGGADGIGLATAERLAAAGATLVLVDVDPALPDIATTLADRHARAVLPITADVADDTAMADGFARVDAEFGRVDVLVNNAGIMTPHLVPVHEVALPDFDAMLRVHLRGAFVCARLAVPLMRRGAFGRIVNLTSVLGTLGLPGRSAYAVAKTGVIGLTRSLAVEGGRYGITANAVLPGWILTGRLRARLAAGTLDHDRYAERTPVGRWGDPADVARMITFLALPASGFLTGGVFPVDGGYCVRGDADEDIGPVHDRQEVG